MSIDSPLSPASPRTRVVMSVAAFLLLFAVGIFFISLGGTALLTSLSLNLLFWFLPHRVETTWKFRRSFSLKAELLPAAGTLYMLYTGFELWRMFPKSILSYVM